MSKDILRVKDYLGHIQQAIERVQRYTSGIDEASFLSNELIQDAVIRNIEIIGESSNNIMKCDPMFSESHPGIPWRVIYTMRNRVSHGYFNVDLGIVWGALLNDLPALQQQVLELIDEMMGSGDQPRP